MGEEKEEKTKPKLSREFSSGGVVYKTQKSLKPEILFLVTKSKPSQEYPKDNWRLPKGWIDDDGVDIPGPKASGKVKATEEDLEKTAIREVKEEGGVEAKVIKKVKTINFLYKHKKRGLILKFVTFYLMEHLRELEEGFGFETEKVEWLNYEESFKRLTNKKEKEILADAYIMLDINKTKGQFGSVAV